MIFCDESSLNVKLIFLEGLLFWKSLTNNIFDTLYNFLVETKGKIQL